MLAQVVGAPSTPLGELGPGLAGSTLLCFLLLAATLLALRLVARRRQGGARIAGPLQLVAKLELSASQSLYLIRAADRCLLIGGSSGGLGLLTELDPKQVALLDGAQAQDAGGAAMLLQRLRVRFGGDATLPQPDSAVVGSEPAPASPPRAGSFRADAAAPRLETFVPEPAVGHRDLLTRS